jgi:hypothetical protein
MRNLEQEAITVSDEQVILPAYPDFKKVKPKMPVNPTGGSLSGKKLFTERLQ